MSELITENRALDMTRLLPGDDRTIEQRERQTLKIRFQASLW